LADESAATDDDGETRQLLRGALDQIRKQVHPQTWQAFWKVVVEGKTPEEVGRELALRPGTVRVAKSRVLSRLRSELGEIPLKSKTPPATVPSRRIQTGLRLRRNCPVVYAA
jgi:RNA polymerase sigma-70 factor (ECF subfamily)